MIILQTPSFVVLGTDEQTPKKVSRIIVLYHTPDMGKVDVWARVERQTNVEATVADAEVTPIFEEVCNALRKSYVEDDFIGVDKLTKMHNDMLIDLQNLNPSITFTVQI